MGCGSSSGRRVATEDDSGRRTNASEDHSVMNSTAKSLVFWVAFLLLGLIIWFVSTPR